MRLPLCPARHLAATPLALGAVMTLAPGFGHAVEGEIAVQWVGQSAFKIARPTATVILTDAFLAKNPKHAASATRRDRRPHFAIPMHRRTNPRRKGAPEQYVRALGRTDTKVLALPPGEQVPF